MSATARISVSRDMRRNRWLAAQMPASPAGITAAAQIQTRSPQIDIESNFFTRYRATVAASGEAITRPDKQEWGRTGCAIQTPIGCGLPTFGWITTQTEQTANIPDGTATFLNVNDSVQLLKITNQQISVVGLDVATAGQNNQLALNFDIGFDPQTHGTLTFVPPAGDLSHTPPRWAHGPVAPGSDPPEWM